MHKIIVKAKSGDDFIVHFQLRREDYNKDYFGSVYFCVIGKDIKTDIENVYYIKSSDGSPKEECNEDCRCAFEFNFCWRGVWEGRIYFKDDEYWSDELKVMSDIWEQIENILKDKIKLDNPNYQAFD